MINLLDAIHISSFDFDGCILPENLDLSVHTGLTAALKTQNTLFKVNIGMIGSNRQDKQTDDSNRRKRSETASAFKTLPTFITQRGMTFDPVLLADVYQNQAHGLALKDAIESPDAYQAEYVFDEFKSTLIYFQIHQAALNACGCDFIVLPKKPDDIMGLSKRSNAAYVYCEDTQELFYINTMEGRCDKVEGDVSELLKLYKATDIQQKRNCFEQDTTFGFRLDEDELKDLGHHQIKHYPIYFDFYDDRDDILIHLKNLFETNPALLPANVVLRLHRYVEQNASTKTYLVDMNTQTIRGQGKINPDPGKSLCQLNSEVKEFNFDDSIGEHARLSHMMSQMAYQTKLLTSHCIETSYKDIEIDHQRGLIQQYLPEDKKLGAEIIVYLKSLRNSWFLFNHQYPVWEQMEAANALLKCLEEPSKPSLNSDQQAVLEHGHLGQLLTKHQTKIQESFIKKPQEGLEKALEDYKRNRQTRSIREYTHFFGSCSKKAKFDAINTILLATQSSDGSYELDPKHQNALTQGMLAKTLKQNKIQLSFVNDRKHALACLSGNLFKLDSRKRKIEKIQDLVNQSYLTPEQRAAALVVAFAIPSIAEFGMKENFANTSSMHRFCRGLLTPNTFSYALREEVFKWAGLNDKERLAFHEHALHSVNHFWDSNRSKKSEELRQKLLNNMSAIYSTAEPVLKLTEKLNQENGNQTSNAEKSTYQSLTF